MERLIDQLKIALLILIFITLTGTAGYILIERWDILDAFYMTIITITTTGFREVKPLSTVGKIFTVALIIFGVGTIAYTAGRAVQLIIETQVFKRRRMSKKLEELKDHYIVCGFGRMGKHIAEELKSAGAQFVIVEKEPSEIEHIIELGYLFVNGDATSDEILLKAGVRRAKGLAAVLPTDAENVFTTLSAKVLNPNIFVVARAVEEETESKLIKAGADRVIKPYEIEGTRMAQMLLRPGVVDFMDIVAREKEFDLNLEEIRVCPGSPLVNKTLAESPIRSELNIIIVAIFRESDEFIYNPGSSTEIKPGDRLIAIGEARNLARLNKLCLVS
jgi:voltage-gated potassium channel